MIKIAVLGHGVVGSGVCELVDINKDSISRKLGKEIFVKKILDLREFENLSYRNKFTKNIDDIINDKEISIVVEVMGGITPAFEYVKRALESGKSVVTSNKELVATKGNKLLQIAKNNNTNFYFEASVGGGIPIIRPMHMCLAANEIDEIIGILNGTTNFILTKMINDKFEFTKALALAQELGYAEREPSADIDGHDACRKICILSSLAFGKHINPENVYTEGITKITLEDIEYASNWGGVIKLIGRSKKIEKSNKIECMVSPAFLKHSSQISTIDDVFNGVLIRGNATGSIIFYGKGAGKMPTASAVIADVIDIASSNGTSNSLSWESCEENIVLNQGLVTSEFYIRLSSDINIDIKKIAEELLQDITLLSRENQPDNEIAFTTLKILENDINAILEQISSNGINILQKIRIVNAGESYDKD